MSKNKVSMKNLASLTVSVFSNNKALGSRSSSSSSSSSDDDDEGALEFSSTKRAIEKPQSFNFY